MRGGRTVITVVWLAGRSNTARNKTDGLSGCYNYLQTAGQQDRAHFNIQNSELFLSEDVLTMTKDRPITES